MSDFQFYVNIENAAGTKLGSGPLASASDWRYTARFDRAGTISFTIAANDPQVGIVQNRRIARAFALLNGVWTEVGAGRIDSIETVIGRDGRVSLQVSGLDLLVELADRNIGNFEVGRGSGALHSIALAALATVAPAGWTFTPASAPQSNFVYARYSGESVLGALVHLANSSQSHFYRSTDRTVVFSSSFTNSGVRAIQARGDLAASTCGVVSLKRTVDTHDLLTRIYPFGSGTGDSRLTLRATDRSAPTGYTLSKALNYIENDAATAEYGLVDHPQVEFKEITPIANTGSDSRSAANRLFDAALYELRRRSTLASQETYSVAVQGCSQLLRPLQTMRLVYRDDEQGISVDDDLYILETTWEVDTNGVRTSRLVVSTLDRWPDNDESAAADRAVQGRVFQAHPQMGPNSYWKSNTLFVGSDQTDHVAQLPFVLGNEVVNVQQVLFRYKVDRVLNFIGVAVGSANVSLALAIDSLPVTISGTINISHSHTVPNHQHTITIIGNGAGALTNAIGYGAGGRPGGIRHNIDLTDHVISTNALSGATTSEDGGSTALSLSGATGSGSGTAEGEVDLSDAIRTSYGVYRAPAGKTYDVDELECRVNSTGSWIPLDTGDDVGNGYYELDLTEYIQDPDLFTPNQENNLIEIRRRTTAGSLTLEGVNGDGTRALVSTNPVDHGLEVGEQITITSNTTYNGTYIIDEIVNEKAFYILSTATGLVLGGSIEINKSAMVLCELGIRNTIQAVAFT